MKNDANERVTLWFQSVSPGLVESEQTTAIVDRLPHLKAEDVADAVEYVLSTPPHVQVKRI